MPLFGHNLRPLHIVCSRPSSVSGLRTHWAPSDHLTISSLPSVFRPLLSSLDFTVCHYTNSLVNTLNSFSSLSLQNPNCEWTQPPHLGLHHMAEHCWKQNKTKYRQKNNHTTAQKWFHLELIVTDLRWTLNTALAILLFLGLSFHQINYFIVSFFTPFWHFWNSADCLTPQ